MDTSDAPPADKASPTHQYPTWVMLDPYTRLNYPRASLDYPEEHFRATYATEKTSRGEDVAVSLRAVPPPGSSRLYVSWAPLSRTESSASYSRSAGGVTDAPRTRTESSASGSRPAGRVPDALSSRTEPYASGSRPAGRVTDRWDRSYGGEPRVVAAHGHSILLQFALEKTHLDFFAYTAHSNGPPSLWRLPRCDHKYIDDTVRSRGLPYMFRLEDIGLLCNGDNEFVVADLKILSKDGNDYLEDDTPVQAGLCLFRNGVGKDNWEATVPLILHEKGQGEDLIWWQTDVVIPFGDYLCYVDYFRGIFFVDVLSKCPKLRFVQLPVKTPRNDPVDPQTGFRGCPAASRSVCVTKGGTMKFVEVVTTATFVLGCSSYDSSSFTINMWILNNDDMTWERQTAMQDTELWSLPGYGDLRFTPSFPLVSMEEPSVIYFVLNSRSCDDHNETWVIVVDMSKRTLLSSVPYTKVFRNCLETDGNMACRNIATNRAFIPCEIPKHLYMPETRKRKDIG